MQSRFEAELITYFLIAVNQAGSSLREEGCIVAYSLSRIPSMPAGKLWQQNGEAAGHTAPAPGKQRRDKSGRETKGLTAYPMPVTQHGGHRRAARNRPWVLLWGSASVWHHCPKDTCSVGHSQEPGSVVVGVSVCYQPVGTAGHSESSLSE